MRFTATVYAIVISAAALGFVGLIGAFLTLLYKLVEHVLGY